MLRNCPSGASGLNEQQYNSSNERDCADGWRNKMVVGRRNVHSKELDGFSRGRETQARVGKHDNAKSDQKDRNDGFHIHNKSIINF